MKKIGKQKYYESTQEIEQENNLESQKRMLTEEENEIGDFDVTTIEQLMESDQSDKVALGMREVKNLKESRWLEYFAMNAKKEEARIAAVGSLNNEETALVNIIETTDSEAVKSAALSVLGNRVDETENSEVLVNLAREHPDREIREMAVTRIGTERDLKRVFLGGSYQDTRLEVLEREIDAQDVTETSERLEITLKKVAKIVADEQGEAGTRQLIEETEMLQNNNRGKSETITKILARELSQNLAGIIAVGSYSKNPKSRSISIEFLGQYPERLLTIIKNTSYEGDREKALELAAARAEKINNPELLAQIVRNSKNQKAREIALNRILDHRILLVLAKTARTKAERKQALEKLENQIDQIEDRTVVTELSKISKSPKIRREVRIKERKIQIKELKEDVEDNQTKRTESKSDESQEDQTEEPIRFEMPRINMGIKGNGFIGKLKELFQELVGI